MSAFTKTHIRCRIYPARTGEQFQTVGGGNPVAFRACGVRFSFSFFDLDGTLLDVSNVASLTLFAKTQSSPSSSAIVLKTASSIDATLTADRFGNGEDHASIDFSASEMSAFAAAGKFDLTLAGTTTDDTLDQDVFGISTLEIKDAGVSNLVTDPVGASPAVTLEQLQGILGSYAKRIGDAGDTITLVSPNGLTKRILGVSNAAERQDDIEQ